MMKKNFLTGLAILFPIVLTYIIVTFLVDLLTKPFLGYLEKFLTHYIPTKDSSISFEFRTFALILSKIFILLGIAGTLILIGILGRIFILRYIFRHVDNLAYRIPGINRLYKGIQETVHTLFKSKGANFSRVVLVPFPNANSYSLAFITNENIGNESNPELENTLSAFLPGTPNPTMGFMLLFQQKDIIPVDMSVEDALKFIISCGVITKGFTSTSAMNSSEFPSKASD